jgi:hypothetical protein
VSANLDISRVVRSWIREDEHDSADRVLEIVLSQLDTTPQRRPWWPAWRDLRMNLFMKAAIGGAAVLVAALVGLNLLAPGPLSPGGPGATPSATPAPIPSATPVVTVGPSPTQGMVPPVGDLAPGRHAFTIQGVTFTLDVPAGWRSNGEFGIEKTVGVVPDGAGFIFWANAADGVFSDPCSRTRGPIAGPTAADMASAIAGMPQVELVSGPTAITLGGQPAQEVVIRVPDPLPCPGDQYYLWYDETSDALERYVTAPGDTYRVWIVDVGGVRIQMDGETYTGAPTGVAEEVEAIASSIRFE